MIDEKDRLLLSYLQKGLTLVRQPFSVIGAKIGSDPADVLLRGEKLRHEGFLSGIRALWDHRLLRYQGSWAAMRFEKEEFDKKAAIVSGHPGVIYGAERDHDLNFWFFITAPSGYDLEAQFKVLEKQAAPGASVFLPLKKALKGASFLHALDARTYGPAVEYLQKRERAGQGSLLLDEMRTVRALQEDLPLTDEPYRRAAEALGMSQEKFLDLLNSLSQKGYLKRIEAHLVEKKDRGGTKTLVVWQIPGEKLGSAAQIFGEVPEVLSADSRPAFPEFPYSVHTLIRAKDPSELEVLVRRIEDRIGKWPNRTISAVREIKKIELKYYPSEFDTWWIKHRVLADEALNSVQRA